MEAHCWVKGVDFAWGPLKNIQPLGRRHLGALARLTSLAIYPEGLCGASNAALGAISR